jgi:hypothetical protein
MDSAMTLGETQMTFVPAIFTDHGTVISRTSGSTSGYSLENSNLTFNKKQGNAETASDSAESPSTTAT